MKSVVKYLIVSLFICSGAYAQRGSFKYFESQPAEYLNKRITVFIIQAEDPVGEGDFRVFQIYTSDSKGDHSSYGWAKVPLENSTLFAKRHPLQEYPYRIRNASGVLKQVVEGDPLQKFLRQGTYYLDTSSER